MRSEKVDDIITTATIIGVTALAGFLVTLFFMIFAAHAEAHEWYPKECCSGKDCFPVDCAEIRSEGDVYIYHQHKILKARAQPSEDGKCHVCATALNIFCIFIGGTS